MMKSSMSKVDELREALKAKKDTKGKHLKQQAVIGTEAEPKAAASKIESAAEQTVGEVTTKLPPTEPSESAREAEDLLVNLRDAEEEAKQHYDKLLRVMAEFENFKKRVGREHDEKTKFANERLIVEILPVLDDLDRILDHIQQDAAQEVKTIAEAVLLVRKTLYNALQKFGLSEIVIEGAKFDPNLHEALSCIQSAEHEDDSIIALHRKGYKLEDRVIRATQVTVTKKSVT